LAQGGIPAVCFRNSIQAMVVAVGNDAEGTSSPNLPTPNGETEAAMLKLLQPYMVTLMRPLIDHVDQLFEAVEALNSDLATERARSRGQHEKISQRLRDIDATVTSQLMKVADAVEETKLEFSGLDERFSDAAAAAAALATSDCMRNLREEFQQIADTMDTIADVVQETAARLTETNSTIADKLEPAVYEQQRRMSELINSSEQEKLSSLKVGLESFSKAFDEVATGLAATNVHPTSARVDHRHGALGAATPERSACILCMQIPSHC